MITCFIRYEIDPYKTAAFEQYARNWGQAIPRCGADLIGLYAGRFVAVEVKTLTGRMSKEQRQFEQLVERKGGLYAVCRSADDARALLERLRGERPR